MCCQFMIKLQKGFKIGYCRINIFFSDIKNLTLDFSLGVKSLKVCVVGCGYHLYYLILSPESLGCDYRV